MPCAVFICQFSIEFYGQMYENCNYECTHCYNDKRKPQCCATYREEERVRRNCRIREYFRCVMYRCTCQRQAPTAYSRLKRLSSSWCWECAKDEIGCTPLPTSRQYALYLRLTFGKQMVFVFNFSLSSLAIFESKFDWIFITTFMIWFLSIFSLWKKNDSLFRHELVDETEVINMSNFCSFFFVWINFINWFANMWNKLNSHISI